ncbi:MAG: tetratricopeptide repeat protein [Deltaproteobacteria bacterium]|nr:tetratricopeptide repeat protein [Deltaproteobacteria bacterium]
MLSKNRMVVFAVAAGLLLSGTACDTQPEPRQVPPEIVPRSEPEPLQVEPQVVSREEQAEQTALERVDEMLEGGPEIEAVEPDQAPVEPSRAKSLAFKHVDSEPTDHVANAKKLLNSQEMAEAMLELEKALYDEPRNFTAAFLLGKTAYRSGDEDLAADAFLLAVEIDPDADEPWLHLARMALDDKNLTEAEHLVQRALHLNGKRAASHNLLGRIWLARSHWQLAIRSFEKALSLQPQSAYYRNNLGYTFLLSRRFDRAVEVLEPLAARTDLPAFMHNNLGLALEGIGKLQEATGQFKIALERRPAYVKAQVNLDRLVRLAQRNQDTDTAESGDEDLILADDE